eukprot:gnl/Spiro4/27094_TR13477_c0_g1_i1.p1 gnl/Spiro4/27094_TR13477_c0_g1~~gnl/Spiro4/27094_TR13477_c0_g1_i1.p1  ORF type:complete len:358 (+),score=52.07 gnl/Spiro4/27094_TR13477_c0_g1_i1:79-1152(+)
MLGRLLERARGVLRVRSAGLSALRYGSSEAMHLVPKGTSQELTQSVPKSTSLARQKLVKALTRQVEHWNYHKRHKILSEAERFVQEGKWPAVLASLRKAERNHVADESIYSSVLKACASRRAHDYALAVIHRARTLSIPLSHTAYNCYLESLTSLVTSSRSDGQSTHHLQLALQQYTLMRKTSGLVPDRRTFSLLIKLSLDAKREDLAFSAFDELENSGLGLDSGVVSQFFKYFYQTRDLSPDQPLKAIDFYLSLSDQADDVLDRECFDFLIRTLSDSGMADRVMSLYRDMGRRRLVPMETTTTHVIRALGNEGRWEEAVAFFEDLRLRKGYQLGSLIWTQFVATVAKCNKGDLAYQ